VRNLRSLQGAILARTVSEENVEIVRQIYDLYGHVVELVHGERWDEWDSLPEWEFYDPDVVLEELAEFPDGATYRGIEGVKRWFRTGIEVFRDVKWEPREITVQGPHVLVDAHGRFWGAGSGVEIEQNVMTLFTFREGRIVHIRGFLERAKALEAAGLSE
jgi:ketosteroid isomerase-like protein